MVSVWFSEFLSVCVVVFALTISVFAGLVGFVFFGVCADLVSF